MSTYYRVYFTPRISNSSYGSEIDVSDRIELTGVGSISRSIDSTDYDIGVYVFGDLKLKGVNSNGYFNEDDSRSIFPYLRDLTKVRVEFKDDASSTTIVFRGLINDEATRLEVEKDEIEFRVLSNDSVIRDNKVPAGRVTSGSLISTAIFSILSQPRISNILSVSSLNINPDLDITIDDGSQFDNMPVSEAIDQLLLVSNSTYYINSSDEIIVKSRDENSSKSPITLYGKNDINGRENIISIRKYNTGKHRVFTSVIINDQEVLNSGLSQEYGVKQKSMTIDWLTSPEKEIQAATRLLEEFSFPKIELEVKIKTSLAKNLEIFDRVSINYPLRAEPVFQFLPTYGVTQYGDATEPYPKLYGSIKIDQNVGFKIMSIKHDPRNFTSTLKLRQIGNLPGDGYLTERGAAIYGLSAYGDGVYGADNGDYFSGIYGAGEYGSSIYGQNP